uniref:Chitin-binding type-2 domain-containing protein n=1 Tax=Arion vulgaris TaxID=1028688 RepID=A0A0B7BU99_9EUPU
MTALLEQVTLCLLTVGVVLSQNVSPNVRATGGVFTCPQENGHYDYPGNCTRYYSCSLGVATLIDCTAQLIYNPQSGFCDWPHQVQNPGCAGRDAPLSADSNQICRNNPGNPSEAFHVAHPQLCNAFYTCSSAFLFPACTFCGEGLFFSLETGACIDYTPFGQDPTAACQTRQYVQHQDKVNRQMDCWPFPNTPNPYKPILDAIKSGNFQRPVTVSQPRTG